MSEETRILISGGTGSLGYSLTAQLLTRNPQEIRILSRNETNQVAMRRHFNDDRLTFTIADVRDSDAVDQACRGIDQIFHLAALKHVPICETQPGEAISINVRGTEQLVRAAIKNEVRCLVAISTDKAAAPENVYGMTKALGEKLVFTAGQTSPHSRFMCIRSGNIVGTSGSVIPLFIEQIQRYNRINLTSPKMTRFFLPMAEAVRLLLVAAEQGVGGEVFITRMPSCRIADLAGVLIQAFGNESTTVVETGVRPGERLHEVLISQSEAMSAFQYDDRYYVILPPGSNAMEHYAGLRLKPVGIDECSSAIGLITKAEIAAMLQKGGILP